MIASYCGQKDLASMNPVLNNGQISLSALENILAQIITESFVFRGCICFVSQRKWQKNSNILYL